MTNDARIGNLQCIRSCRGNELEGLGADVHIGNRLFDLRHVTGNTFVSGTGGRVMGVRFEGRRPRAIGRVWTVALKTENSSRLDEVRVVFRAMHIVTAKAAHAVGIHLAGNEIVSLHPILVGRAVTKMRE